MKKEAYTTNLLFWATSRMDWTFEFSKCTFFVGVNTTNAVDEGRCYWNSIQITSNGDTDDYCVHKCFTLGLSCLYSLR